MNARDARLQAIIDWIRQTTDVTAGRGALVPVSGGSDSALGLWLCSQALPPGRVIGAYVGTKLRCREWFEQLGPIRYLQEPQDASHIETTRWAMMLSLSLEVRGWLVGTRNRTEDAFGTYSLASRIATLLPTVGLWKSEVMTLASSVGVPEEILRSSQRADPSCGRPQAMADIPFEVVDRFLQIRLGERPVAELESIPAAIVEYLDSVYRRNQFKRDLTLRGPGGNAIPDFQLQLAGPARSAQVGARRIRGLLKSPHASPLTVEQMDESITKHLRERHAPADPSG